MVDIAMYIFIPNPAATEILELAGKRAKYPQTYTLSNVAVDGVDGEGARRL